MNDTNASAIESRPSANNVKLPVVVDTNTSAIPIPSSVQTEIQAARLPSSNDLGLSFFFTASLLLRYSSTLFSSSFLFASNN